MCQRGTARWPNDFKPTEPGPDNRICLACVKEEKKIKVEHVKRRLRGEEDSHFGYDAGKDLGFAIKKGSKGDWIHDYSSGPQKIRN